MQIEKRYDAQIPVDIEKMVRNLISKVPKEHLVGLGKIVILDNVTHKRDRYSGAIYWPKTARDPAEIEIAVSVIFRGMPRVVYYFPFISKFMLADALYHEIGHHRQYFTHGVSKKEQEICADNYKRQILNKVFWGWLFLLLPLVLLIRWLNNREQNKAR